MKVLLTGATGYIGKRLLFSLVEQGHTVVCCVRDASRMQIAPELESNVELIEADMLNKASLKNIPNDIEGAYYLVHSMSTHSDFSDKEEQCAANFRDALNKTQVKHLVYLSGIVNEEALSEHLKSRKNVERVLAEGSYHFTTLRAGIIIGSGSASFEIIRDIVEKLPVMIAPKWLNTLCQPIGIVDVIELLSKTIFDKRTFDQDFDIGGPDVLSYKEMLMVYAKVRGIKRSIGIVPVMTPKLSSYWLYFVTSTSFKLASALVSSMKVDVVCRDNKLEQLLDVTTMTYEDALKRAFSKVQDDLVMSSWKDSFISSNINDSLSKRLQVPEFGCFIDKRTLGYTNKEVTIDNIWQIGGKKGWYYGTWLWEIRGILDKMVGGVGLRRGRTNATSIAAGDALDFWRVLLADKENGRLVLFAEMKLPGEAWLEFKLNGNELVQTATFRPKGLFGRLYWYSVVPFHHFIFNGMIKKLAV